MPAIIDYDETQLETLEALLSKHAGDETYVSDTLGNCHPQAVVFYNESPNPEFKGFAEEGTFERLWEANLEFTGDGDSQCWRIERLGEYLVLSMADQDAAGVYHLSGEIVHSPVPSKEFYDAAILECCNRALEPVQDMFATLKAPGVRLSDDVKQKLIWGFVKTVTAA